MEKEKGSASMPAPPHFPGDFNSVTYRIEPVFEYSLAI